MMKLFEVRWFDIEVRLREWFTFWEWFKCFVERAIDDWFTDWYFKSKSTNKPIWSWIYSKLPEDYKNSIRQNMETFEFSKQDDIKPSLEEFEKSMDWVEKKILTYTQLKEYTNKPNFKEWFNKFIK